ncbi:MAG: DUF2007 domain-containing protein [Tissierellaceae bacterium]|jgi:hypothetical protein
MRDSGNDLKLIKLRSVKNEMELNLIKEILNDNNIPYIVEDHGPGGHMRIIGGSSSLFGSDIMVKDDDYDDAVELLESIGIE